MCPETFTIPEEVASASSTEIYSHVKEFCDRMIEEDAKDHKVQWIWLLV